MKKSLNIQVILNIFLTAAISYNPSSAIAKSSSKYATTPPPPDPPPTCRKLPPPTRPDSDYCPRAISF